MKLSLVVPCYNEEGNVEAFYREVKKVFDEKPYDYEIVFINDGSKDGTQKVLESLYEEHSANVVVVNFSRNFGKEAGMYAGFQKSCGELVAVIDADLQQRPEIVAQMVDILDKDEEYDCVAAYQERRRENKVMTAMKSLFYKMINWVGDVEFREDASDFRTFRRTMVDAILALPEYHRFSKGIFSWVGFRTCYIPYEAEARHAGETKWSFKKLVKYALDGFIAYTTFPLRIATFIGSVTSVCAVIYLISVIIEKLFFGIETPGYATIVVLMLFLGGMQLLILGIIGEYLARIYIQGKNRPIYIEKKSLDYKKDNRSV